MFKLGSQISELSAEVVATLTSEGVALLVPPTPSVTAADSPENSSALKWLKDFISGFWPFLRTHRIALIIISVVVCAEMGLEAGQRAGMRYLIDEVILRGQWNWLTPLLGALLGTILAAAEG